jgi:hypothetical protein
MAEAPRMTVERVVGNVLSCEHGDFVRETVRLVARSRWRLRSRPRSNAARGEISAERTTDRNGYRPRPWETRVG